MYTLSFPKLPPATPIVPPTSKSSNHGIIAVYNNASTGDALWVKTTVAGLLSIGSTVSNPATLNSNPAVEAVVTVKRGKPRPYRLMAVK